MKHRRGLPIPSRVRYPLPVLLTLVACHGGTGHPADDTGWRPVDESMETAPGNEGFGCDPEADDANVLEGEAVTLSFACEGEATADRWTLVDGPPGGELDPATGAFTWTTDLASAGEWQVTVKAEGSGFEYGSGRIFVTDALGADGNQPVDPATYTMEFGLPVFHLAVPEGTNAAKMWATTAYYGGRLLDVEIQRRGATSSHYPKTSFRVDFPPQQEFEDEAEGFPKRRSICLTTTFDDNAYIRQALVYDLWNALDPVRHQLESMFVVLYLDGAYTGLYMLTDRINGEWWEDYGFDEEGSLYKSVDHQANFYADFDGVEKEPIHAGWEKKHPDDEDYTDLDELLRFIIEANDEDFDAEIDQRLVVDEIFDWWNIAIYTSAYDTVGKNAYLFRDPGDTRFHNAVWDFNFSLGQTWETERQTAQDDWDFTDDNNLFNRLRNSATYGPAMQQRFRDQRQDVLTPEAIDARIDAFVARIDLSAQRDWSVWREAYMSYENWSDRDDFTEYPEEVEYVRAWVEERHAYVEAWDP